MKKSYIMAGVLTGALVLWMLPGLFAGKKASESSTQVENALVSVEVRTQNSESVTSVITAQGDITPNREVTLRAETNGTIKDILIQEGQSVKEGDIILRLDMSDREIRLERARARVAEAKRKHDAAKNLGQKGYAAQSRVDEALALLKDAQAEERQILLEIEDTEIRAPFEGILDKRMVDIGDYVSVPDEIVTVVDNTPLVVAVPVPQREIDSVKVGGPAMIVKTDGSQIGGQIRFVSPKADQITRTFRVEVEIANPQGLASGTSADVFIPKGNVMAHAISPGILTLDDAGETGVKIVDEQDTVRFFPVKIVSATPGKLYVSGIPDRARIIVNGQGYVRQGEKVRAVEAAQDSLAAATDSGLNDAPSLPPASAPGAGGSPSQQGLDDVSAPEMHNQRDDAHERVD